jgi:hypothetical protein
VDLQARAVTTQAVPFAAHVELLQFFLTHRDEIVERIQGALNAQYKSIEHARPSLLSRPGDCFFTLTGITDDQAAGSSRSALGHASGLDTPGNGLVTSWSHATRV